jgi:aspartate aminotransferase-like enzyme
MKSFNPPIRTLMGPGPSDVHPRILSAMARPTIGPKHTINTNHNLIAWFN